MTWCLGSATAACVRLSYRRPTYCGNLHPLNSALLLILTTPRWEIVRTSVFQVRVDRSFRMARRILQPVQRCCFERLVGIVKLFDGFLRRVFDLRELLRVAGASCASWTYLRCITA